jgi:Uma2 family endonuclease
MHTITPTIRKKLITAKELLEMGDIGPCELIEGRIVKMSPTNTEHSELVIELGRLLANFVVENKLGKVMGGEAGIYTKQNPDTIRAADLLFISFERRKQKSSRAFLDVAPELIIEIVSPGDRWQDLREKIEEYFAIGVTWIWIVEPKKKAVLVFTSATEVTKYEEGDTLAAEGILKGFQLNLKEFFSPV